MPASRHVAIRSNVSEALAAKLARPCRPYFSGGVALSDDDRYRMPDVFVSCTPVPESYVDQPRLLVEVFSPSTAREDRTAGRWLADNGPHRAGDARGRHAWARAHVGQIYAELS